MKKLLALLLALSILPLRELAAKPPRKNPKNIILLIGDGTGLAHLYAAYTANGGTLDIFSFAQFVGISITPSADDYITDSAAGANAFSTGKKTKNGMVAMDTDSAILETICETAAQAGLSTGAVVSCELPHATPAAFYSHQIHRNMYREIAADMSQSKADVLIGGGYPYFDTTLLKQNGYQISIGSEAMELNQGKKQICFYNTDSVPAAWSQGRGDVLKAGAMHAIQILSQNKKGFFLMVEGSQIDWGAHNNDSDYVITEALDFDRTAGEILRWAQKDKNTLVIITADHECGGLTLIGYDKKNGRPVTHFSTEHHTAEPVPVLAFGPGAEKFAGVYQNTEIYWKMMALLQLEAENSRQKKH